MNQFPNGRTCTYVAENVQFDSNFWVELINKKHLKLFLATNVPVFFSYSRTPNRHLTHLSFLNPNFIDQNLWYRFFENNFIFSSPFNGLKKMIRQPSLKSLLLNSNAKKLKNLVSQIQLLIERLNINVFNTWTSCLKDMFNVHPKQWQKRDNEMWTQNENWSTHESVVEKSTRYIKMASSLWIFSKTAYSSGSCNG